ncbi:hypothetical protein [Pseudactinotalea sp.]|uniref:hypothetical protein n=1 Tax=Pseudactinotalea sp. TaxID=1926260 RepID=UPI003B3AF842
MAVAHPLVAWLSRAMCAGLVAVLIASGASAAVADDADPAGADIQDEVAVDDVEDGGGGEGEAGVVPAQIVGTVSLAAPGESAADVRVAVLDPGTGEEVAAAVLGEDGGFELSLPPGAYTLLFTPAPGTNAREVYLGGAAELAEADVIEVVDGEAAELTTVTLPLASVIAGSVIVQGEARVGNVLSVVSSGWLPSDVTVTYRWLRDGVEVAGGDSYTLMAADAGRTLEVEATGSSAGLEPASQASVPIVVATGAFTAGTAKVSGTPRVGVRLTASTGGWPAGTTLSYQWQRNGTPISGATSSTYTPVAADRSAAVRVVVTGRRDGYQTSVRTSSSVTVAAGTLTAPTPRVSGTVRVGNKLTAVTGSWTAGTRFTYQWYVAGKPVSGQTGASFTPRPADVGKTVTVRVTGALSGYTTVSKTSGATAKVAKGVFPKKPTPTISGTVRTGMTLRVVPETWSPSATLRYQWRVDGKAVPGATSSTYKVRTADRGKRITVTVTASRSGYTTASQTSAATARVVAPFTRTAAPKITGTVRVGSTLTATTSAWSPTATLRYQWYANGKPISGATSSKLKLTTAHYGAKITVKVTGSRSSFVTTSRTSAATKTVAAPPATITRDGTYKVGSQIAAGTYMATGGAGCYWERRRTAGTAISGVIENDFWMTSGRVIVTIKSTDKYFDTDGCGSWTRLMPTGSKAKTFGNGTHAVGIHIAAGTYVARGGDGCYWERRTTAGSAISGVIANDFRSESGRVIVTINSSDKYFVSSGCGTWTRLPASGSPATTIQNGTHAVGIHVRPGTYRSSGVDTWGCYWEVASNFSGSVGAIVENDVTYSSGTRYVTITSGQSFTSLGCGTWTRTGN